MKRHVRHNKHEPLVDEVELLEANPLYAHVRLQDGRQATVSTKHLAPMGTMGHRNKEMEQPLCDHSSSHVSEADTSTGSQLMLDSNVEMVKKTSPQSESIDNTTILSDTSEDTSTQSVPGNLELRRSTRIKKTTNFYPN